MARRKVTRVVEEEIEDKTVFAEKATKVHTSGDFKGQPAEGNEVSVLPTHDEVIARLTEAAGSGDPKSEARARDLLVIARAAFGVK
jgi:hypothetical protein